MVHDFTDVARFERMFDAPGRAAWQRPVEVVALLGVTPGQTVADLGAGTGYFEPLLSLAVGRGGRVLALDSEPAMVEHLARRAEREGLGNVEARRVEPGQPGLAPASVDRVLIVDTWHHLPERGRYAAALRDALRAGGSVLVVDFTREASHGPPVEARLAAEAVAAELRAGGLEADVVRDETLPDQYVVRGTRPR
jgi:SAM-dependent methyltransferase